MARARNIKPGFFKNEFLAELPIQTRLLFIGLWTLADREGRLEDRPGRIKAELFPFDNLSVDQVNEMLTSLASIGSSFQDHAFIIRYSIGGKAYIQIVAFDRNQNPHKKEKPSVIPPYVDSQDEPAEEVPDNAPDKTGTSTVQDRDKTGTSTSRAGLIPSSLIPSSLIPDSLNSDSLKELPYGSFHPTASATPLDGGNCRTLTELIFPLQADKSVRLPRDRLDRYRTTYGDRIDVDHTLQKAVLWLEVNPQKRPRNQRGMLQFLTKWLSREDERERKAIGSTRNETKYSTPTPDDF
jgi:hypothetical protein